MFNIKLLKIVQQFATLVCDGTNRLNIKLICADVFIIRIISVSISKM